MIPVYRLDDSIEYVTDETKTSRSRHAESLRGAIADALNEKQTERDLFCSALGCTVETAFEDMCSVKRMWHKEDGVQGYHLVQSFAAGEVTPELAHQVGLELAEKVLGGRFQVIVSTHLNTGHIHNHLLWNSVSVEDGAKYHSNRKTYLRQIRTFSDELCRKYGLSVIETELSERSSLPYVQWLAEKNGKPTWKTPYQQDIAEAVAASLTWRQFLAAMERRGYTFRFDRKYPTLLPPGREHPIRFRTLGRNCTPEAIQRRILYPCRWKPAGRNASPPLRFFHRSRFDPWKGRVSGLRALYFSYLYKMGVLRRKPGYPGAAVREELRLLDRRIEQAEFVFRNHIADRGQLDALCQASEEQISALLAERRRLSRNAPGSPRLSELTVQLRQLRRTVRLCRNIARDSAEMERRLQADRRTRQQEEEQNRRQQNKNRLPRERQDGINKGDA